MDYPSFSHIRRNNHGSNYQLYLCFHYERYYFMRVFIVGFISTCMSNPFDVVKTRMMEQHQGKQLYKSSLDCFVKVYFYYKSWFSRLSDMKVWLHWQKGLGQLCVEWVTCDRIVLLCSSMAIYLLSAWRIVEHAHSSRNPHKLICYFSILYF